MPVESTAAQSGKNPRPALVIDHSPVPTELKKQVYSTPTRARNISSSEISGHSYYGHQKTVVTRKVEELQGELSALQSEVAAYSAELNAIQRENQARAADYFAAIATINTQLQSGTTPGNPRLTSRLSEADAALENLGTSVATLNQIASALAESASKVSFLLESTRAAYSISGAVEEDHVMLAELEDSIHNTAVIIERVLNNVNDDITRTSTYLSSERNNLRTLSLAVANGDLYGKSLSDRPFSSASPYVSTGKTAGASSTSSMTPLSERDFVAPQSPAPSGLSGPRPLVKIRFDRPDVDYEQPVYLAVNEALDRYPNARFDLVAVHPSRGNAAEVAIESTRARRNAERVLSTLTQMGLPLERIDLSYNESQDAASNEVHIYIR